MSRLETLRKLAALEPNDPMTHYGVGLECLNLKHWDDAIAAFDRALECDTGYSAAYYHRARAEIQAGRYDEARQTLDRGVRVADRAGDLKTVREMQELQDTLR